MTVRSHSVPMLLVVGPVLLALGACSSTPPDSAPDASAPPTQQSDASADGSVSSPPVDSGSGDASPGASLPKGSVQNVGPCAQPAPSKLANTTCQQMSVQCPGLARLGVEVLVSRPPDGIAVRGTVVLGTGGGGTGFYEASAASGAMVERLRVAGFIVVQRAWENGWHLTTAGMAAAACRYATLLQWVRDSVHTTGGFCATGNSAGSAEIAFSLSRYGMDALLDFAVPTGGPPVGRMDEACPATQSSAWPAQCAALVSKYPGACPTTSCTYNDFGQQYVDSAYSTNPCTSGPTSGAVTLRADSVASPDAKLNLSIPVHAIMGKLDCTQAVSQGLAWYDAIQSQKTIEFVDDTEHEVQQTVFGSAAIEQALTSASGCIARPHS